jgi:tetratricopeptide (TPR) repeat protein
MKRTILAGTLCLATGLTALVAQQPQQQGKQAPPAGQQQMVPGAKSAGESQAVIALMQAQGNPDATIKAAEDLLSKYSDTTFKETALLFEANAYQSKGDLDKAQVYGEQVLAANPKNYQVTNMLGTMIVQRTRENDLDKEERLAKAEKYFNMTLEDLKTATKPNPQLSDAQWEEGKKFLIADAHNGLGMVALTRKKYDAAAAEFKQAADGAPDEPSYQVRLASALQQAGKNDEAIAICDKVLATPNLHPQIKQVATNIKAQASKK